MRLRIARPTRRLADIVRFYEQGLGLRPVSTFRSHAGYDGVIFAIGMAELEFTQREGAPAPPPATDEHLVVYYEASELQGRVVARLREMGAQEAMPANPWWRARGDTFVDPDGLEVVLLRAPQAPERAS